MMGILVDSMKVTRGSLDNFKMNFSGITIIYGENQSGKTSTYETLEACIARPHDRKKLNHRGGDFPSGLSYAKLDIDGNKKKLTPSNKDSICDYARSDVPESLLGVRPFMVRGSHAGLTGDDSGIDVEMLKKILVRREEFTAVKGMLSSAAKDDEVYISDGFMVGNNNYKEIKESTNFLKDIYTCNVLLEALDAAMTGGELRSKTRELEKLTEEKKQLEKARRFYAYALQKEIQELKKQKEGFNREELDAVSSHISNLEYSAMNTNKDTLEQELEQLKHLSTWIQEAKERIDELEKEIDDQDDHTPVQLRYALLTLAAGTVVTILTDIAVISVLGAGAAGFFIWRAISAHRTFVPIRLHKQDIADIYAQAKEDHGLEAASSTDLSTERTKVDRSMTKLNTQLESLEEDEQKRRELEAKVREFFLSNGIEYPGTLGEARQLVKGMRNSLQRIDSDIVTHQGTLEGLAIEEDEYLADDPGTPHDPRRLKEVIRDTTALREEVEELDKPKRETRERICAYLQLNNNATWEELVSKLQKKLDDAKREYREWIALYVARRACHEVLKERDESVDALLNEVLSGEVFSSKLQRFTGNYISMKTSEEGKVGLESVDGDMHLLEQVSSGAREQALLALRLGLIERYFGDQSLFLMLDDAFVFSDDAHARGIIDTLIDLHVRDGWQIIYMTKDEQQRRMMEQVCGGEGVKPSIIELPKIR